MLLPPTVFLQDSPERTKAKLSLWRLLWQSNVHTQVGQSSNLPHVGLQTLESVLEEAGASLPFPKCWNTALWLSVASHTVHDQAVSQKVLWKKYKNTQAFTSPHINTPQLKECCEVWAVFLLLLPRRNCACLSWQSLRRAPVMIMISRQTIGWSGKFINLENGKTMTTDLTRSTIAWHRYHRDSSLLTHMSYNSLPAEAVLSAFRSIMYISYCGKI